MRRDMKRILIVGAGAIGGTLAVHLGKICDLFVLEKDPAHREIIAARGITLKDGPESRTVQPTVLSSPSEIPKGVEFCFLCTRAYHLGTAAGEVLPYLHHDALLVSMNNGICLEPFAEAVGELRAVCASIRFGVGVEEPGVYKLKIKGGLILGMKDGYCPPRLNELANLIDPVIPCRVTDNILGELYSKMLINACMTSAAVLSGQTLGEILASREGRMLFDQILFEGVKVAEAEGVKIPPYDGKLRYGLLAGHNPVSAAARKLTYDALAKKYADRTSSTLDALLRGVPTETDFYNGYLSQTGRRLGVPTPVNDRVCRLIAQIEQDPELISPINLGIAVGLDINQH